ncbi:MAG: histone deacetylase [Spirochaetia bacterium]|nr:histone deacetylase [Spirochaetota bacterium]MCX8096289.1 histone deacetylase [Spirochaetota bacterium]MDW8113124.1 histone deacetylase [Spirochaetia bacterium]
MSETMPINRTGIFYNPFLEKHLEGIPHIERPERTRQIYAKLKSLLGDTGIFITPEDRIPDDVILLVHTKSHLETIMKYRNIKGEVFLDPDTVVGEHSVDCAILSSTLGVKAVIEVMEGNLNNAFVLSRPPGHHATQNKAMGFCIFNNVAIAAELLIREYNLSRVAIVDFDVHHGNGTQDIFYESDKVLFISTHRYPFYPGTGFYNQIGRGNGIGFTVNIPLPEDTGDNDFAYIYSNIVSKILKKFEPEFLLVSAGFDAHYSDPLGGMTLTDVGFRNIANTLIKSAPEGKTVFILEGGYNVQTLPSTVYTVVQELISTSEENIITPTISETTENILENVYRYINDYWGIL